MQQQPLENEIQVPCTVPIGISRHWYSAAREAPGTAHSVGGRQRRDVEDAAHKNAARPAGHQAKQRHAVARLDEIDRVKISHKARICLYAARQAADQLAAPAVGALADRSQRRDEARLRLA